MTIQISSRYNNGPMGNNNLNNLIKKAQREDGLVKGNHDNNMNVGEG